jgi:hypothetical protein
MECGENFVRADPETSSGQGLVLRQAQYKRRTQRIIGMR